MDAATGRCIPQLNTSLEAVLKYRVGCLQDIQVFGGAVLIVYVLLSHSPKRCQNETVAVLLQVIRSVAIVSLPSNLLPTPQSKNDFAIRPFAASQIPYKSAE
jgi:hypothetical protein